MLDDLKYIHQRDGQDALGIAEKQWQQYTHDFDVAHGFNNWRPGAVMLAGMGGSAQAATALAASGAVKAPFEIIRNYDLPAYVDNKYLLICCSYSGNTEETLSIIDQALALPAEKRPKIVLMSAGGEVHEKALSLSLPFIQIPQISQPRFSFGYQLAALSHLLEKVALMEGVKSVLEATSQTLQKSVLKWRADVATKDNQAKQLANEIAGKSQVIYAGPMLFPAAYKWKINFNENAKNVAWCNQFPEFNHNEFIGWSSHPIQKPYSVIELRSKSEHLRIQKRFDLSNKLLSGRWPEPLVIDIPKGTHILEEVAWAVALGDFVSVYVALLNGVNPSPVELVEKFKTELNN